MLGIAAATGLSRVLGLVREAVIANQFGASGAYDAYLIAFFIPHFLRKLLAEGALSNAFIPLYSERLHSNRDDADAFASTVISVAVVAFPLLALVGVWLAPLFVPFLADGFSPVQRALAVELSRLTFPFIALVGLAALAMGVLNGQHHFLTPALAPVLFNVGVIAAVVAFNGLGAASLALGVLLGGTGQLLVQLPALRGRLRFRWRLDWRDPGLRQVLALLGPAVVGLAVVQLNVLVDNKLASRLPPGSISALQYAIRLFQLPLGMFAVAISTAILPRLATRATTSKRALLLPLRQGVMVCGLILVPATLGLWLLGKPTIRLLFEHGAFSAADTLRTFEALRYYALGLVPYGMVTVLVRAFYALKDGKSPGVASAAAVASNVALSLLLVRPLGLGGLALATAVSGWVQLALVWGMLTRQLHTSPLSGAGASLQRATLFSVLMGVVVWLTHSWLAGVTHSEWVLVFVPLMLGLGVYAGLLWKGVNPLLAAWSDERERAPTANT